MHTMLFQCHPNEIKSTKPISHELLEEILLQLAIKNQERIESCKYTEYIWSSDTTEFVFNICEKLTLKKNVKYVALEIYERFVAEHIVDLHKRHSEISKTHKNSHWETVEERIKEQSVLRIMTSVQLASKLESHYENVLPAQVSEVLERIGKPYSLNGIFSSELRILKTLNYKVNLTTPALYVGLLLYILYTNDPSIEESLYDLTTTILDFVYLHRAQLYNELYDALGGDGNDKEKDFNQNFLKVKADYMLLATSVIAATAYLFMNKCYELILEQLHQITRKVKTDIKSFSVVIAYVVMNDIAESLRCSPSLRIHVQLFIALVLQGTSMSMATTPLFLPQYTQPAWLCLFLVVLQMYSGLSSTNWMFIEGLHLHSRLTSRVFQKEAPLAAYHILGWGIPFICTGIWFSLMSRLNVTTTSNECWSGYGRSLIIWIITGPMMAALTVNSLFLIDIIRILISKRMCSNRTTSETEQLRKAVKATALLFPLLGIPHLLFCINPGGDGAWEEAYMFANATLKSSQGFFVSILYCFMNAEVQITLKKAYMRCLSRRSCTRSGTSRQTSTTYVTSQSDTKKSVTTAL